MNFIIDVPIVQPIVPALGWTQLHFLWQGALLAALLYVILKGRVRRLVGGRGPGLRPAGDGAAEPAAPRRGRQVTESMSH